MDRPRLVAASLSGQSDADWARRAGEYVDLALLGGIAIDAATRTAARELVERDREEFLPSDPIRWIDRQLGQLNEAPVRPGINVRSATVEPVQRAAKVCAANDAVLEINAHCRQPELCAVGCGETLLADTDRLTEYVATAAKEDAVVSVKVRTEVDGVDLPAVTRQIDAAGATFIHVDAMDSEPVVGDVAAAVDALVIANNEVRGPDSVREYFAHGADAVSVGRPSDNPAVLERVRAAIDACAATP